MNLREKVQKRLESYNISSKSKLGQHFLVDETILDLMASRADKSDIVIEVGPGVGQLTELLAEEAHGVFAVEIDQSFEKCLTEIKRKHKNIEVVIEDFLKFDIKSISDRVKKENKKLKIITSLPFHITEPFLAKTIKYKDIQMILLVGENFGRQALIKNPNSEFFSELSFLCNAFYEVNKVTDVPKDSFMPLPKTKAMILEFTPRSEISLKDYVSQNIILTQKHGAKLKNALMNSLVDYYKKEKSEALTKNQAREIVASLNLADSVQDKAFSQLSNHEIRLLATSLEQKLQKL